MTDRRRGPPIRIFKYRDTGPNTERIFKDRKLYFASPGSFNDPFDCSFHVLVEGARNEAVTEAFAWSLIKDRLPDLSPEDQVQGAKQVRERLIATRGKEFQQIVIDKLSEDTNKRVGICCFTEVNDDILMWAHYADCHRGICLEFASTDDPLNAAQPVEYTSEYPALDLEAIVTKEELRAAAPWMLRKADHWSYEKEWRVLDFKTGPGAKLIPTFCLTGVILGCRIPPDEEARVQQWIADWPSEIKQYRARQSKSSFRLDIEQVKGK
jgi:hypothetical protein